MTKYETLKLKKSTLQALRLLSALTGKSMVDIIDNFVSAELRKAVDGANASLQDEVITEPAAGKLP